MYGLRNRKTGNIVRPRRIPVNRLRSRNNNTNINVVPIKNLLYISEGVYGDVLFGLNKNKNPFVRKTPKNKVIDKKLIQHEYDIHKKIYSIAPNGVTKPLRLSPNGRNININYVSGGTLRYFINIHKDALTDGEICVFITQVLKTLQTIHKKDPSFRHNDLHSDNILVDDDYRTGIRLLINDFGLSTDSQYKNPDLNYTSLRNNSGIYIGNGVYYDAITFLIDMMINLPEKFKSLKDYIYNEIIRFIKLTPSQLRPNKNTKYTGITYKSLISKFDLINNNNNNLPNISKLFINTKKYSRNNLMKLRGMDSNKRVNIPAGIRSGVYEKIQESKILRKLRTKGTKLTNISIPRNIQSKNLRNILNYIKSGGNLSLLQKTRKNMSILSPLRLPVIKKNIPKPRSPKRVKSPKRVVSPVRVKSPKRVVSPVRPLVIRSPVKNNFNRYIQGKNKYKLTYEELVERFGDDPTLFIRKLGFIPLKKTNKGKGKMSNLPYFHEPLKLRNEAILGVPHEKPSTSRVKNIFSNKGKRWPLAKSVENQKLLVNLFGSPSNIQKKNILNSPKRVKVIQSPNYSKLRPFNIEENYKKAGKSQSNAVKEIERIVREGRKKKQEAWEKAQKLLGKNINIVKK